MSLRSTWYKATLEDGSTVRAACNPDIAGVSLRWNEGYVHFLRDWSEKGLRALIESESGRKVKTLSVC